VKKGADAKSGVLALADVTESPASVVLARAGRAPSAEADEELDTLEPLLEMRLLAESLGLLAGFGRRHSCDESLGGGLAADPILDEVDVVAELTSEREAIRWEREVPVMGLSRRSDEPLRR
jgi:hypothetical protein